MLPLRGVGRDPQSTAKRKERGGKEGREEDERQGRKKGRKKGRKGMVN